VFCYRTDHIGEKEGKLDFVRMTLVIGKRREKNKERGEI